MIGLFNITKPNFGGFSKHKVHFFDILMLEETTVIQSAFKNILFLSVSHMFGSW